MSLHGSLSSLGYGVGVDGREQTNNEPRWLVVVVVGCVLVVVSGERWWLVVRRW